MDNIKIEKEDLELIVSNIISKMNVYGPVPKQDGVSFEKVESFSDITLDYTHTTLPPKKFLFPQKETLFTFKTDDIESSKLNIEAEDQCLFGVHPCDINGILLLDKVFSTDHEDPYYLAKREKTIIIGTDCTPDDECFCTSLHTEIAASGYDLMITPVHDMYVISVATDKGEAIIRELENIQRVSAEDMEEVRKFREEKKKSSKKKINADYRSLPLYYSGAFELDLWEEHAERCFSCGSCVMVCPTCYCFNVEDEVELNLVDGKRERTWDSCMLKDFSNVATGENFRGRVSSRLKHRFNRKFQFHMLKYGKLFCIGCGRCSRACLADIKPADVTNEIIEAKKNGK